MRIPFGRAKGETIGEASTENLTWIRDRIAEKLDEDPDGRFSDENRAFVDTADAELAHRQNGGAPARPAQQQPRQRQQTPPRGQRAIQRSNGSEVVAGSLRDAGQVNARLRDMASEYHLVAPATVCGSLPEGCEVAISVVHVDSNDAPNGPGEVYQTGGGKLGLAKATLDRIGSAAGITWDPQLCRRLDDGRDPYYVAFQAVGYVRNFDGSIRTITGTKEMDLRDGSPQVDALHARIKKDANGKPKGDATKQIREMRLHILGHAETKAKLRAIRSVGIKTGYTKTELDRPFAIARLMFTGKTDDPELKREFARMNAQSMIGGVAALYGGTAPTASPAPSHHPQLAAPRTPRPLEEDDIQPPPAREVETSGSEQPYEPPPAPAPPEREDWDRGANPDDY